MTAVVILVMIGVIGCSAAVLYHVLSADEPRWVVTPFRIAVALLIATQSTLMFTEWAVGS